MADLGGLASRHLWAGAGALLLALPVAQPVHHSLDWYKFLLGGFTRFLEANGAPSPRETTPNHFRAYLDHLRERGISSITVDRTYGGLRCFFRYLTQERLIPQNPVTLVEKPRKSQVLIHPLSMDQVRLLLAQPKVKTFVGFRNWVMMLTLVDTGLRLGGPGPAARPYRLAGQPSLCAG